MFVYAVSEHQSQLRVQNYISIWVMFFTSNWSLSFHCPVFSLVLLATGMHTVNDNF